MAGKKNDAIEIDALLTPELGDMGKVERDLSKILSNAAKPLVDTISNAKVGLNPAALRKVQKQLDGLAKDFGDGFDESISKVLGEQNKNLRSAKGLRQLAKADSGIAQMVKILGGYDEAASILGRPDAQRRLNQISSAFKGLNDTAYQISKLPAVGADVQKMLANLYKSNTPNSFKKLSEIQQRQVMDAMAVIDLQDKAFNSLKGSLAKAGLGVSATELSKQLKQRKNNATRLSQITSPDALVRQEKAEARASRTAQERQERLNKAQARSQAVSLEKDRVLGRTGGIQNLRKKQDIGAVRAGLNRDYNMAVEQASIAAMGKGGKNSASYKAATGQVDAISSQRAELDRLVKDLKMGVAEQIRVARSQAQAEQAQLVAMDKAGKSKLQTEQKWTRMQADHEDKARTKAQNTDALWTRMQAGYEDKQRAKKAADAAIWTRMQADHENKARAKALSDQEYWTLRQAKHQDAQFEAARKAQETLQKKRLKDEEAWAWSQAIFENKARIAAAKQLEKDSAGPDGLKNKRATNMYQAREIIRSSGGDYSALDKDQIRTLRPYAQDRFRARSQYAEKIGANYGTDSPEFAKASASAQQYARALGELDKRAKELRPSISDLGQVVRSFFRYALGYGALYEMLGAVTALTKGLVDLDEQLYNIQAITLSTDNQMQTIEGSIKQVGLTTKFTLNEVAKGAQILAQAGTAPEAIPQQLRAVADFAAATGSSLEQSADLLTSFKIVFKDISDGSAADLLTKTLNLSKLQGEDQRTIVSYTAQTAEGYNISAEQLMGAVATLRNVGIKPSTIATGLRQTMLEVFNPDAKLLKALKIRYGQLGEETSEEFISARYNAFTSAKDPLLAAISELKRIGFGGEASNLFSRAFDVRAFNPLQALVNNADQYSGLSAQVGIGRSAVEGSEIQLESLRATLENLGASVIAFSDSVGGDMVRSLQQAAEEATNLVGQLTELDQKMKLETGAGLGSTIMGGLAGGALGAVLGGKGFLGRAGGFTAGAFAGGGLTQADASPESGAGDYILPAIAALSVLLPGFMKLATAAKGMKGGLQLDMFSKAAGGISAVGSVTNAVEGIAGMTGKLGKFSGIARVGMIGAGLFARAIPVIGWLWTAYEILKLFSDEGAPSTQAMADQARIKAAAAGDRSRQTQTKYTDQQAEISSYRIDEYGNARAGTTAAAIVNLRNESNNLNLSMAETFGANAAALGEAGGILRDYQAKSYEARQADLKKLSELAGKTLTDADASGLATQLNQLDSGVENVRQGLAASLQRSVDNLKAAVAAGDAEGVEAAGKEMRALDALPELRDFFFGRVELTAGRAVELLTQYTNNMADEAEKGVVNVEKVIADNVATAVLEVAAVATSLESSAAIDTAVQGIITGLELTGVYVTKTLEGFAESARAAAVKHGEEAAKLEAEAASSRAQAGRLSGGIGGGAMFVPGYLEAAGEAEKRAGLKRREEQTDLRAAEQAEAKVAQRKDADKLAAAAARTAAQDVEKEILGIIDGGRLTDDIKNKFLSASDRAILGQLQGDDRTKLVQSGFFKPIQAPDGTYKQSPGTVRLEEIVKLVQRTEAAGAQVSEAKKSEAAKTAFASDPTVMVQIARLQNEQKAAERRNDFAGASGAAKRIADLQYAEQAKAVKRAEVAMAEAKDDPKKDATAAVEKYNSELAKLESLRGDMTDKLDEYQKKVQDIDLKRRTVETELRSKTAQKAFGEAVDRGDLAGAQKAGAEYATVQAERLALAKEELALKGYSAEQIELEVRTREDLTTTLIDQEGAQKRLTAAIIARADFEARNAGTGPSTGNKMVDSYLQASGVGFTDQQYAGAFERDLSLYRDQLNTLASEYQAQAATMIGDREEARAAEQAYVNSIEQVQAKIGETSAKLQQLRNNFSDELFEGLNPTAIANQLSQSGNTLQNFGENLRNNVVTAVDSLGQALANAVIEGDNLKDSLKAVIHEFAVTGLTQGIKLGVTEGTQGLLGMFAGDGGSGATAADQAGSVLGKIFGLGGAGAEYGMAKITAGAVYINGTNIGGLGGGGPAGLGGGLMGPPPADGGATAVGQTGSLYEGLGDVFTSLKTSLTDSISGLGSTLTGVFSSLFGGAGSAAGGVGNRGKAWGQFIFNAAASYYGGGAGAAAGGAASSGGSSTYKGAQGFADGGMPSRKVEGKRGQRDNLLAAAVVNGQVTPIKVESDEGILSRKAMKAIGGEAGLKLLNSGNMPRFAVGGTPQPGYNPGQPVSTGADRVGQAVQTSVNDKPKDEINIANIYSEEGFADFVSSRGGRKVIINMLRKEGVV